MQEPIVQLIEVTKRFGKKVVLDGVTLDIYPQEIFALIGVSGAGKTTFLRSLIGFYPLDAGRILFDNKEVGKSSRLIKKDVGFSTQDGCFYDQLTVIENITYFGKMYGLSQKSITQRADALLDLVHLSGDKHTIAKNLSGGMKRRLDISCALIHDPPLLILDEPTIGLDPILRSHFWRLIHEINKKGTTIIVSSHLLGEIEKSCTRVGIISDGKIVECGTPDSLKRKYSRNEEIVLETVPANYFALIRSLKKENMPISSFAYREHKLVLYTPRAELVLRSILNWVEEAHEHLIEVNVNKPSLSEVFEALMKLKEGPRYSEISQLKFSVHSAHRQGFTKEQIRHMLLKQNWDSQTIEKVLSEIP